MDSKLISTVSVTAVLIVARWSYDSTGFGAADMTEPHETLASTETTFPTVSTISVAASDRSNFASGRQNPPSLSNTMPPLAMIQLETEAAFFDPSLLTGITEDVVELRSKSRIASQIEPAFGNAEQGIGSALGAATDQSKGTRIAAASGVIAADDERTLITNDLNNRPVRRRDPIDLPLIDESVWFEWLLSVTINSRLVSDGALILENNENGELAISDEQARRWRLKFKGADLFTFQGVSFLPMAKIEGAQVSFDKVELALDLEIPPSRFEGFDVELGRSERQQATASNGLFLDYDLLLDAGQSLRTRLDGLVEAGAFSSVGVVTTNMQLSDLSEDPEIVRLESAISRDFPEDRRSIRIGDDITVGDELATGVRFAGLRWGTNFAIDPTFVSFPLPTIGGLAEQESVVDVIVDNITRATETVPPGPFAINNVPVVTGGGEVQIRVTDLLGREQIVTQPYYASSQMLRAGLHDFAYMAGFEREQFGQDSFDYDRPLMNATHRYGLSDEVTLQTGFEATSGSARASAGGSFLVGQYGLFTTLVSGSADDEADFGWAGAVGYEFSKNDFSFSARTQLYDRDYRTVALRDSALRRSDQLSAGIRFGSFGRLGLLFLNRSLENTQDPRSLSASYSVPIGEGAFIVRAGRTFSPDKSSAVTATFSMPLGAGRSTAVELDRQNDQFKARASYRKNRTKSDLGLDYRLSAEAGDRPRRYDARASYTADQASGSLDLEHLDGDTNARANLSGSLAMIDGDLRASRRLGRAFGLVTVPGHSDVRIYMDNRLVGTTDNNGELIVPGLRPYQSNRLRLDVDDLPLTASFGSDELVVTPFDRTGVMVDFEVEKLNEVTARLHDLHGEPLAMGALLGDRDGQVSVRIGRNGFAYIKGSWSAPLAVAGQIDGSNVACVLPVPPSDEVLPDIGVIECAPV